MSLCFCVCTRFCLCLCSICFTILLHWIGGLGRNSSGRRTSPLVNRRARSLGRSQRKKCLGRLGPGREKGLEVVTIRGMGLGYHHTMGPIWKKSSTWPLLWLSNGTDNMSATKLIRKDNEKDASFLEISFAAFFRWFSFCLILVFHPRWPAQTRSCLFNSSHSL